MGKVTRPTDWEFCPLNDICEFSQYGINSSSGVGRSYPILRMNNLQMGRIDTNNLVYIDLSDEEFKKYALRLGDLLVNRTNSYDLVGKTALFELEDEYVFASYLVRFRLDTNKVFPQFINYYFNSYPAKRRLQAIATKGVSQANINPTVLKGRFFVPLPPLPEQRKIAEILGMWDQAITLTERLIAAKQRHKRALMQQLLTGRRRFREFIEKHSKQETNSNSTHLPEEWHSCTLGDCCFVTKLAGFEYTEHFDYSIGGEVIVIRALNIKNGRLDLTNVHSISTGISESLPRSKLNESDLVMGYVGSIGGVALIEENNKYHLAPNVAKISPKQDILDPRFLLYQMQAEQFQYDLVSLTTTTTQPALSMSNLRKAKLFLPGLPEQRRIAAVLQACDAEIELLGQKLAAFKRQKKGLMQKLLTGEVRVVA